MHLLFCLFVSLVFIYLFLVIMWASHHIHTSLIYASTTHWEGVEPLIFRMGVKQLDHSAIATLALFIEPYEKKLQKEKVKTLQIRPRHNMLGGFSINCLALTQDQAKFVILLDILFLDYDTSIHILTPACPVLSSSA